MTMVSYAQNREDVLLARCFPGPAGFYVDIGAADPVAHSVTKWFSEQGWTGINVEPSRDFFRKIEADRTRDINLNVGVSDVRGQLTFYEIVQFSGCSTFVPEVAAEYRRGGRTVTEWAIEMQTLAEIFAAHAPTDRPVDFLKIDVEGLEPAVLAGMDFRRWRPKVLVVEATRPGRREVSHELWEHLILPFEYHFAFFDGLNRYYVRGESNSLLAHFDRPACPFDDYVLYDVHYWQHEAVVYHERADQREVELQAKETELLKRCRDFDDIYFRWTQSRVESESIREVLGRTQDDLAAVRNDLGRTRHDLARHKKALTAARTILAETRTHVDDIRTAAIVR